MSKKTRFGLALALYLAWAGALVALAVVSSAPPRERGAVAEAP